jgi:hypothetical protein
MVAKCANTRCSTPRRHHEGKMFRLDIELGNKSGEDERQTEYVWLCACCAQQMHPEVVVTGDTITLQLSKNDPMLVADTTSSSVWVN